MEDRVGDEVKLYGKKVLLHYGSGSIKKYGLYDKVLRSLKEKGIEVVKLGGVEANPKLSLVKKGIDICRKENIDFILAVGGGSVIDSAKAMVVGVPYEGDVWDFFIGFPNPKIKPKNGIPLGVIVTIAAAGSEMGWGSVITKEEGLLKKPCVSEWMFPKFAMLNPEVTYTCSNFQSAAGAFDVISHVMEGYFTEVKNVELSDRLSEGLLRTVIRNTPIVLKEPKNYNARAEIMWSATLAHNLLLWAGRIPDLASHSIELEISGMYDITHGAGMAIVFPAWMKYVYEKDLERFAQFAVRVWNVETEFRNIKSLALEGIERLKDFAKRIGLPTTLGEANISTDRLEEMAQKCTEYGSVGNFAKLDKNSVLEILMSAK